MGKSDTHEKTVGSGHRGDEALEAAPLAADPASTTAEPPYAGPSYAGPSYAADIEEEWLGDLVSTWPGAAGGIKPEWEIYVLTVGGKLFGLAHENRGRFLLTFKADPLENEALRDEFDEVIPGYHMNKRHWSSLVLNESRIPVSLVTEFVRGSYELVFASLTKREQAAIAARHMVTRHLDERDGGGSGAGT